MLHSIIANRRRPHEGSAPYKAWTGGGWREVSRAAIPPKIPLCYKLSTPKCNNMNWPSKMRTRDTDMYVLCQYVEARDIQFMSTEERITTRPTFSRTCRMYCMPHDVNIHFDEFTVLGTRSSIVNLSHMLGEQYTSESTVAKHTSGPKGVNDSKLVFESVPEFVWWASSCSRAPPND